MHIGRKAFLAKLPAQLSDHHLAVLERGAHEYCSSHRISKTPRYVALYCLRDRPRTSQAWQRHLRQILSKLGLPLPKPGTRWLELIETAMFHGLEHFPQRVDTFLSNAAEPMKTGSHGDKVFEFHPNSCAAVGDAAAARKSPAAFSIGMKSRLQVVKLD